MTLTEPTNKARNEMKVMVLTGLAALCKHLADNPAVTDEIRAQSRQFVAEYNQLAPFQGKGQSTQHYQAESLIARIARFLPRILEIESRPAVLGDRS